MIRFLPISRKDYNRIQKARSHWMGMDCPCQPSLGGTGDSRWVNHAWWMWQDGQIVPKPLVSFAKRNKR